MDAIISATAKDNTETLVIVRNLLFRSKARQTSEFPKSAKMVDRAKITVCMATAGKLLVSSSASVICNVVEE